MSPSGQKCPVEPPISNVPFSNRASVSSSQFKSGRCLRLGHASLRSLVGFQVVEAAACMCLSCDAVRLASARAFRKTQET